MTAHIRPDGAVTPTALLPQREWQILTGGLKQAILQLLSSYVAWYKRHFSSYSSTFACSFLIRLLPSVFLSFLPSLSSSFLSSPLIFPSSSLVPIILSSFLPPYVLSFFPFYLTISESFFNLSFPPPTFLPSFHPTVIHSFPGTLLHPYVSFFLPFLLSFLPLRPTSALLPRYPLSFNASSFSRLCPQSK
jgi:hypothetical protein